MYKGVSEEHGIVAIKRLDRVHGQGDHEFQTEIKLLSKYKHDNIASLLGFCDEDGEKILVYKHESNESLDKHLNNTALTWIQRLKICIDAARGLKYLHDDIEPHQRVLHRDVKSANILLDDNWNAKISDFGLSKISPANMSSTFLISAACGTHGYIDPEFLYSGYLTQKSDVFSFGVVLFEVLCGRPACVKVSKNVQPIFYVLVQKHFKKQTLDKIIHFDLRKQIDATSLLTFSTIAYQCLMSGEERPTMKKVEEKLQKALNNQLVSCCSRIWFYIFFRF